MTLNTTFSIVLHERIYIEERVKIGLKNWTSCNLAMVIGSA